MTLWLEIVNVRLVEDGQAAKVEVQVRGDKSDRVNSEMSWFELPSTTSKPDGKETHKDGAHGVYKELAEALEKKRLAIAQFGVVTEGTEPRVSVTAWRIQFADPAVVRS